MARPHTPRHGDSSSHPEQPAAGGADGGGGGPPRRRSSAGSAGDGDNVAAAQESAAAALRMGRPSGGGASPGSTASVVQGPAAKIPLKPPNNRHNLDSIRPKNPTKDKNTIVLPGTDVSADLA